MGIRTTIRRDVVDLIGNIERTYEATTQKKSKCHVWPFDPDRKGSWRGTSSQKQQELDDWLPRSSSRNHLELAHLISSIDPAAILNTFEGMNSQAILSTASMRKTWQLARAPLGWQDEVTAHRLERQLKSKPKRCHSPDWFSAVQTYSR